MQPALKAQVHLQKLNVPVLILHHPLQKLQLFGQMLLIIPELTGQVLQEIPLFIPSDSPKIHASGAFGGYTPHEFRIFLYSETATPVDQLFESKQLNVIREVQSELILSPLAAKELTNWLSKKIDDF